MDEVDDFLAHYGVKGMKWGERKARPTSSLRRPSPEATKYVAKEIGFGSIAPAAMLMGLGPPISIALGISVGVLRSPPVASAIKTSSKASADLMKEIGQTKLAAMKQARESKQELKAAAAKLDASGILITKLV